MHNLFHRKIAFVFVQLCLLFVFPGVCLAQQSAFGTIEQEGSSRSASNAAAGNGNERAVPAAKTSKNETSPLLKLKASYREEKAAIDKKAENRVAALLKEAHSILAARIDYCTKNVKLDAAEKLLLLDESLSVSTLEKAPETFPHEHRRFIRHFQKKLSALKALHLQELNALNKKYLLSSNEKKEEFARAGDLKTALQFRKFSKDLQSKLDQNQLPETPVPAPTKPSQTPPPSTPAKEKEEPYKPGLACEIFYGDGSRPPWSAPGMNDLPSSLRAHKSAKTVSVIKVAPPRVKQSEFYGLYFNGEIFIEEEGEYTVHLLGSAKAELFIDGAKKIWRFIYRPAGDVDTSPVSIKLTEGWHRFELYYIACGSGYRNILQFEMFKGKKKIPLSAKNLRHASSENR